MSNATNISNQHAIVIGGSMAGLLAARVLSDHFARITIIERDCLPIAPEFRHGTPQARHVHVLMQQGQRILGQLFPGLIQELEAHGAVYTDVTSDMLWLNPAGWTPRHVSGLEMLCASRTLIEWGVRQRLMNIQNVFVCAETDVQGLLTSEDKAMVTGVQIQPRSQAGAGKGATQMMHADLVIDTSGRNSKMPQWLTALGYQPPPESLVNAHLGYASRVYEPPTDFHGQWKAFYIQSAPPEHPRGGLIFPMEGGKWLVSTIGSGASKPPTDEAGFEAFVRSLRSPLFAQTLQKAKPLSPVYGFGSASNQWRHYERLTDRPDRLVIMGDAFCAFNPVYGQGMTIAALEAMKLGASLTEMQQRGLTGVTRTLQRELGKLVAGPWSMATGEDCRYLDVEGVKLGRTTRIMHWYMDRIMALTTHDEEAHTLFTQVIHMVKPPTSLFHPHILWRALRGRRVSTQMQGPRREAMLNV